MKKEKSLEIINKEIARWEAIKDVVERLEKGKTYRIKFHYTERLLKVPGDWKTAYWKDGESVFIGTVKEFNKASINFEVLTVQDVEESGFRYKLRSHAGTLKSYHRALTDLERRAAERPASEQTLTSQEKKDKDRYIRNIKKPFHCSVNLEAFLEWEEWEPNPIEVPLMVNYEFISEKMKKLLFGV